jgi:hypothetical protein
LSKNIGEILSIKENQDLRALIKKNKVIEKSRDGWKEKNHERYCKIKALKVRKSEVELSRDKWKIACKNKDHEIELKESLVKALEEQLILANISAEQIKKELDDFKKKLKNAPMF